MVFAARRFARRVLLSHLALLLVVFLAVGLAAKYLYAGARTQVITQAEQTQMLLARQTAAGIENYYESITNVLNLLQPNDNDPATQPAGRPQAERTAVDRPGADRVPGERPPMDRPPGDRFNPD